MLRFILIFAVTMLLLGLGSCGGGDNPTGSTPLPDGSSITPVIDDGTLVAQQDGFSLKVLSDTYTYGGQAEFRLVVSPVGGATAVTVIAEADDLRAAMVKLAYDPAAVHPVDSTPGAWPGLAQDEMLRLLINDLPGEVHYGTTVLHPEKRDGVSGEIEVLSLRFAQGPFQPVRDVAKVPDREPSAIPNLIVDFSTGNLAFSYYNVGDYNQDSLVGVSDLTPLGVHYGEMSPVFPAPFPSESIGSVIDGNGNALIEVSDLTQIGQNYENTVTLWRLYGGAAADYPQDAKSGNGAATVLGTISFVNAVGFPWEQRLRFTENIAALTTFADEALWLRPVGNEDDEGTPSNMVQLGVDVTPPVWTDTVGIVSALAGYGSVNVSWGEAVDAETPPVVYAVYYTDAVEMNFFTADVMLVPAPAQSVTIEGLTDGVEYMFVVRAMDSATPPNEDDNAAHLSATPGTDMLPPVWTYQPDGITEVIAMDGGARVLWGEATDADTPPVTYTVYYNAGSVVDFDTATTLEIAAVDPPDPMDNSDRIREVTGLTNGTEYAFAVRAKDSVSPPNEDTNTNTLTVIPLAEAEVPAVITEETMFDGPMKISAGNTVTVTGGECLIFLGDLIIEDGASLIGLDDDLCVEVHGNFICDGTIDLQLPDEVPPDTDTDSMKLVLMGAVTFGPTSIVTGNGNIYLVDSVEELLTPEEVEAETDFDTNPEDYPFNWMPEEEGGGAGKAPAALKTTSKVVYYGPRPWQLWLVQGNWGKIPAQPRNVRRVILRCAPVNGQLHFQNFSIEGPPGKDGDSKVGGCYVIGGDGEDNRFRLRVHTGRTMTFNNVNIKLGDGGNGGDATTDHDCKPGYAEGGKGGKPNNKFRFTAGAGGGIHAVGSFNFNPGNGGDGGHALAFGADGVDGCPAEDGWDATGVGGEGGECPRWGMRVRGNVTGLANMTLGVAEGGEGGSGAAMAGSGGNDTCCPGATGGSGGDAAGQGGRGGDSKFNGQPAGTNGGGAKSGDGGWADTYGGNGGNGASCQKLPGGDGGAGGMAISLGGDPGVASGTGGNITQGNQGAADAVGGDGGDGGDGWGPGVGGDGGDAVAQGSPANETDGEPGDDGDIDWIALSNHEVPPASPSPVPGPFPPGIYPEPIYDLKAGGALVGMINVPHIAGGTGGFAIYESIEFGMILQLIGDTMITYDKSQTIDYEGIDADWIGLDLTTLLAFTELDGVIEAVFYLDGLEVSRQPVNDNLSSSPDTQKILVTPGTSWDRVDIVCPPDGYLDIQDVVIIDP